MILYKGNQEVEVRDKVLAEDLLIKWGYEVSDRIEVKDIYDVTSNLSIWGVPWKWIS